MAEMSIGFSPDATTRPLDALRDLLLHVKPVGPDGFEGLVADAIAAQTGLVIRLAKSGLQYGRDASSVGGSFAVALEAKRYDSNLGLEDLAGKAVLGGHDLSGSTDLWILGATSEVGDQAVRELTSILDGYGIVLLVLDWTPRPLPPLAVLLASVQNTTLAWFAKYQPDVDQAFLAVLIRTIEQDQSFAQQAESLRAALSAAEVGLDSLRRHTNEWLRLRLANRRLSQRTFGQFIVIADPSAPVVTRPSAVRSLDSAMGETQPGVIAVVGEEGVGKTWLVAQWWAELNGTPPILILVTGRRADFLSPTDPLGSLAKLIAEQQGDLSDKNVQGWRRRLRRWKERSSEAEPRFLVLLDGLNEHPTKPWADIIKGMVEEVAILGGRVVITSRETFWKRDVLPRMRTLKEFRVSLEGYAEEELDAILKRADVTPSDVPHPVRQFIRNPRVCTVALNVISRLSLHPGDLTVERLLLEYWQSRVEERGDLIGHGIEDFEKLLRGHARAWLAQPGRSFDRDEWTSHSGAVRRSPGRDFSNDLTEIEEGRFLQIVGGNNGAYTFRKETLPYALALLLVHELKTAIEGAGADPLEILGGILDSIRGFDIVAEIMGAAVGLVCIDETIPQKARAALVTTWLGLQNVSDEAFETLQIYLRNRPEIFLDAMETPQRSLGRADRQQFLSEQLLDLRDHPTVHKAIKARLPSWLGRWSREPQHGFHGEAGVAWVKGQTEYTASTIAALTSGELSILQQLCNEMAESSSIPLDRCAALIIAGRPQAYLASAFVGWALAHTIAGGMVNAAEDLGWVLRLNRIDHAETADALRRVVEPMIPNASIPMRRAVATTLDLLGTDWASAMSAGLVGVPALRRWRRVERFCETNPHDPAASPGSNLYVARDVASKNEALTAWNHMFNTAEDLDLEAVTPALARFDPSSIVESLRRIVQSISERSEFPLRQLSWNLPELSPIFDPDALRAVESGYARIISKPELVRHDDLHFVTGQICSALLPHYDPEQQLECLLRLPTDVPLYLHFRRSLRALPAEKLESHLERALSQQRVSDLRRILFFASGSQPALTDRSREIIVEALHHSDMGVVASAADLIFIADDASLNSLMLGDVAQTAGTLSSEHWYSRALACAVVQQHRHDLLHVIQPKRLGFVAAALGGPALIFLAETVERVLHRLLKPINVRMPVDFQLVINTSENGREVSRWTEDVRDPDPEAALRSISESTPAQTVDRFAMEQQERIQALERVEAELADEGAADMVLLWHHGLAEIADQHSNRVEGWLDSILDVTDSWRLRQVHNLGVALAGAFATTNAEKSSQVLKHVRGHRPFVQLLLGGDKIPLYEYALFSSGGEVGLSALREEFLICALDDASLERAVMALQTGNGSLWLEAYVSRMSSSEHPADQALAITIAGLRHENTQSDHILARDRGTGFLGNVSAGAMKSYRRAQWARHWIQQALDATDPVDFWRFGRLAEGVADYRFRQPFEEGASTSDLDYRFGQELYARLEKAAEERTKKRKATLYGLKAPKADLLRRLSDR